jgi:hypothetical protein
VDLYRVINESKKGYQPRTNFVKVGNSYLHVVLQYLEYMEEFLPSAVECTWG